MDAVTFITKLQKFIKDSYQNIGDSMISGAVDSMGEIQVYARTGKCLPNNNFRKSLTC
jgi:hypothetical protein